MERHEVLNRALGPLDEALAAGIDALRARGLYEPLKRTVQGGIRAALSGTLRLQHRVEIVGAENVPEQGGCIIAANHQSWLDVQVLAITTRRRLTFVAKAELQDWPVLRRLLELDEALFIKSGAEGHGLDRVAEAVEAGRAVVLFPEGAIPGHGDVPRWDVQADTGLLKGRSGVVRVAMATGAPVIPCGLSGTGRAFPPEAYPRMETWPLPRAGELTIRFGAPMTFRRTRSELTRDDLAARTAELMRSISALVDHSRNYVPITLPIPRKEAPDRVPPMAWTRSRSARAKELAPLGVLVLPGFASGSAGVAPLVPELERMKVPYRVPILSGHGGTWRELAATTPGDWYRDAEDALLDLGRDAAAVVVIGLSTGALLALELAARRRSRVAGVIAVAPPLIVADPWFRHAATLARITPAREAPRLFSHPERRPDGVLHKLPTATMAAVGQRAAEVVRLLAYVKAPLLVLQGRDDRLAAPAGAELLRSRVSSRDREVFWLERSGHEALRDADAREALLAVATFLGRVRGQAS